MLLLTVPGLRPPLTFASSDFGNTGSASGPDYTPATCTVFTGPRDLSANGAALASDEFLLTINNGNGTELSLTGRFDNSHPADLKLLPNRAQAESSFAAILRAQANDPHIKFRLDGLSTDVHILPVVSGQIEVSCHVRLTGHALMRSEASVPTGDPDDPATGPSFKITNPVALKYSGTGIYYPGVRSGASPSGLRTLDTVGGCSLPANLQPGPQRCSNGTCLLDFAGFKWWTYNQYYPNPPCAATNGCQKVTQKNPHPACPCASGYWNNNNTWSPLNSTVDQDGLHLFVKQNSNGPDQGGPQWMASELVLLENGNGSAATLGYGTYLVTARVNPDTPDSSWSDMDPNVTFGAFIYEKEQTGTASNPARELDLAEISRWGHTPGETCSIGIPVLCDGNAQFTLQKYDALPHSQNIKRYTIDPGVNEITLVMQWNGAKQHVCFKQYNGSFSLDPATLPEKADYKWETADNQTDFIPASGCQRFVLNFWMGKWTDGGKNPPPSSPQEVVVTNFQYKPLPAPGPGPQPAFECK
jgi:hypothetical protein